MTVIFSLTSTERAPAAVVVIYSALVCVPLKRQLAFGVDWAFVTFILARNLNRPF